MFCLGHSSGSRTGVYETFIWILCMRASSPPLRPHRRICPRSFPYLSEYDRIPPPPRPCMPLSEPARACRMHGLGPQLVSLPRLAGHEQRSHDLPSVRLSFCPNTSRGYPPETIRPDSCSGRGHPFTCCVGCGPGSPPHHHTPQITCDRSPYSYLPTVHHTAWHDCSACGRGGRLPCALGRVV